MKFQETQYAFQIYVIVLRTCHSITLLRTCHYETGDPSKEIIATSSLQCEVDFARQGHEAKECGEGDPLVMQEGFRKYGVQRCLHSNRHTIFRSPNE